MKLIVVCEALGDFDLAACLVRRSLHRYGPRWFEDLPSVATFVDWSGVEEPVYVKWTSIERDYRARFGRPLQARKTGPYSLPALQAILMAGLDPELNGLILMVDLDREPERRETLLKLRDEAADLGFEILIATPDPEREAWVLPGFEPANAQEKSRLTSLKRKLGFDPRLEPHRLRGDARRGETRRDIKQVLGHLVDRNPERESRCWENPSRGAGSAR